jgi:hypothetical protein
MMGCGRRVRAVVLTAAAFICCVGVASGPTRADDEEARAILFSGRDIWRNGAFAHGGLMVAPWGLDQDGFFFKLLLSGGVYRYDAGSLGGARVVGRELTVQAMPGFRVKRGDLETKVFVGLDLEKHRLWPDDSSNRLRGSALGLRFSVDFWYEPTPTTMFAMDASLSTVASNQSARAGFGWRVIDDQFYFGPEIAGFASDGYRHYRLGLHFTGLKTDNSQWLAAGGWARDSDGRASPYVRLGLMQRL